MTTKETLEAARALIARPENWMRGDYADGYRYCALGAIDAVWDGEKRGARKALRRVIPPTRKGKKGSLLASTLFTEPRIFRYNDTQTHECVIAAFDAAIERAER